MRYWHAPCIREDINLCKLILIYELVFFILQYKKAGADGLMGAMPLSDQGDGSTRYTEKLSPSVNLFLAEASRQDSRVCTSHVLSWLMQSLTFTPMSLVHNCDSRGPFFIVCTGNCVLLCYFVI